MRRALVFGVLFALAVVKCNAGVGLEIGNLSEGTGSVSDEYLRQRAMVLKAEEELRFDADIRLSATEGKADEVLQKVVDAENSKSHYLPNVNFFYVQKEIEQTPLFHLMKKMPKGGILHLHSTSTLLPSTLIEIYLKHADNCYTQFSGEKFTKDSQFSKFKCFRENPGDDWKKIADVRNGYDGGVEEFDKLWASQLEITSVHGTIDFVWPKFQASMDLQGQMILYLPVLEEYTEKTFESLEEDNVLYVELRHVFGFVYDLDKSYTPVEEAGLLRKMVQKYTTSRPTKFNARYVDCGMRRDDVTAVAKQLDDFLEMRRKYGDFVAAFDLVGQEDLGHTALYFAELFEEYKLKAQKEGLTIPLYLHDGETTNPGDQNVVDAILLGSKRIGHGFDLVNHPALWDTVKDKKILVEISPISNQVLKLEKDIRNHPGRALIAAGIPVNINSDDPGSFGYEGVSHDYYAATASWNLGLKSLKQLGFNAIAHSGMTSDEKMKAIIEFSSRWQQWVEWLLKEADGAF